jgi:hypothetical protein
MKVRTYTVFLFLFSGPVCHQCGVLRVWTDCSKLPLPESTFSFHHPSESYYVVDVLRFLQESLQETEAHLVPLHCFCVYSLFTRKEIIQKTIRQLNIKVCMSRKFRIHPFIQPNTRGFLTSVQNTTFPSLINPYPANVEKR